MKVKNIVPMMAWCQDLLAGVLINHQPKRKNKHSEWYLKQLEKEGRNPNK